ncbi:MAG TPA: glycosyltransferase [Acidimicrobiales bacterium]|nr:glycosyltransferase [Acidimicrobiales bacterium]
MRVAMVSEHASPLAVLGGVDAGGQNVHVASLGTALADHGVDVVIHTRRDSPHLPRRVALAPGVTVDHVPGGPPSPLPKDDLLPHMSEFADDLRRAWEADRPDVVHAHFWMSGLAALDAAASLDIPVVQTFHALGVVKRRHQGAKDTSPPARTGAEAMIARRAVQVVATCTDEVRELVGIGADPGKVSVIPCGVDLALFRPDGPSEGRLGGRRRLVVVSRLVERKGIGNVIEALPAVPDTDLVIAGGSPAQEFGADPEVRRLRGLAELHGVGDRVTLRGRVGRHELPALLRSADAVVCVPWYEPFGIVPLEAMACGVPVVASAVGGLLDTVVDGRTGVHVPPRRPDLLGRVLALLLDEPDRRRKMGAAGARRARAHYGWPTVAATTLGTYASLLDRSSRLVSGSRA